MNYSKDSNTKKQEELNSKSNKVKKTISTTFIKILVFVILLGVIIGVGAGLGVVKAIIDGVPEINFNDIAPEGYTTFIYDQNGNEIAQLHGEDANRIYVEIDQIPSYLQDAFIAVEDERFWDHNGIDLKGIIRAVFVNLKEGSLSEGASTITQQVIKNNVLTTVKTFERKIQEQYLALQLEKELDKEEILENYLNTVALGRGTNGVQVASHRYFNKDVWDLTIAESAVLAGITQRPTFYDPISNPDNNKAKQLIILDKMLEQGKITQEEYDKATNEDVYSHIQTVSQEYDSSSNYSYFVDEVITRVKDDLVIQKGYTESQAYNLIYRGGLSIYVTQDTEMQEIVDEAYTNEDNFPPKTGYGADYAIKLMYTLSVQKSEGVKHYYKEQEFDTKELALAYIENYKKEVVAEGDKILAESPIFVPQPQSSMVIMDYHTGYVKAIAGGRGEKIGNQVLNRATQSERSPGSTFKILAAYLPAIDTAGYTLGTVIDDVPFSIMQPGRSKPYAPKNWYDSKSYAYNYYGLSTVREGIEDSMNILAIKTIYDIGTQTAYEYLMKLGFTSLEDSEKNNYSLALGGLTNGVSMLELTAAYGAVANKGVYTEPLFYTKVLDHDGSLLLDKSQPVTRTVMKETTAYLLTSAMESVVRTGTGTQVRFKNASMPIAGKTGTSQEKKDLVFAGYTPYYVAALWEGYDKPKEQVYARSYHKYLWRDIMEKIHEDLPRKEFERPSGIVSVEICTESGKLAIPDLCENDADPTSSVRTEYYVRGTEPTEYCDVHIKSTICTETGLFATEYCPEDTKQEKIFIVRPEPLVPENWNPNNPPRIRDRQFELPANMVGEYCNIHGPVFNIPNTQPDINENEDSNNKNNNKDRGILQFIPFLSDEE